MSKAKDFCWGYSLRIRVGITWNIHMPILTDKERWKVHWSTTEWQREVWGKQSPRAPTTPRQQWQQLAMTPNSWFDSWRFGNDNRRRSADRTQKVIIQNYRAAIILLLRFGWLCWSFETRNWVNLIKIDAIYCGESEQIEESARTRMDCYC